MTYKVVQGAQPEVKITTFLPGPPPPSTAAGWVALRVAMLHGMRTWPSGRVVVALLEAAEDARALREAVAAGAELDVLARWAVTQTLDEYRERARREFAQALPLMDAVYTAWTRKHGAKAPDIRRDQAALDAAAARAGYHPLPAAGTGASVPRSGPFK